MNAYPALITSGIIFAIIAIIHLVRIFYRSTIIVAGVDIPIWVSAIGLVVSALLSIWMFMASMS